MQSASASIRKSSTCILLSLVSFASAATTSVSARELFSAHSPSAAQGAPSALPQQYEQRLPRQSQRTTAAVQGIVRDTDGRGVPGAEVTLVAQPNAAPHAAVTDADGVFRFLDLPQGHFALEVKAAGFAAARDQNFRLSAGDISTFELVLAPIASVRDEASRLPRFPELGPSFPPVVAAMEISSYQALIRRPDAEPGQEVFVTEALPPSAEVFLPMPDRWNIAMPGWNRYGRRGEYPYVPRAHWWDPYNRNKLKGDEPIFGRQTFLNFTATADTLADARRLPEPSGVSAAQPGSTEFFGKGNEFFLSEEFRFSFDLFHGDTSFRPADWRIRVTPAVEVNFLKVQELGIVSPDVRNGTSRFDSHVGLQEAFVEYKIRDLSPNYDFLSVRAGIQGFSSDFRGFLFVDEQPGVRFFGNLHSDRWEYNLAYFNLLEKDTNSGLNTFQPRHQQVVIANLYLQDFCKPGYTAQFSVQYNKDDASTHYDENGFLVRPAPVGAVLPHNVRAVYLGWTGNGHFGRWNLSHAFYQALGNDDLNPIAGRPVTINAQMAAAEVSLDKDWSRFKASLFYASGDANPRDGRARGFDAIVDDPAFAGGIFSLWNREGIRLTGTGVALTAPDSLLPDLRPNKEEGQANFVNPGIFIANAGADFNLTPKLKGLVNLNYLRFDHTEPLELLLFQNDIRHSIGFDADFGVEYRPPLSENIVITGGAGALLPGQGFRDIYSGKTLLSAFAGVRFKF